MESVTGTLSADPTASRDTPGGRSLLVLALHCSELLRGPSSYPLDHLDVVEVGRGKSYQEKRDGARLSIAIDDAWMSSRHARLVHVAGGWHFEDLESRNGSRVNDRPANRAELFDGDVLELGRTIWVFRAGLADDTMAAASAGAPADGAWWRTTSPRLAQRLHQLSRIGASDISVLVRGESGTGKELAARALHDLSGRRGAFVAVNCGGLPETLAPSELFGYRKGAFSGAGEDRLGLVRAAEGGTLFLDEIGDLPASSQAVLLRVLQERAVTPVGDTRALAVDVRVIAATHRDLEAMIDGGSFRHDLFARVAGFELDLPPLRERREDLGLLLGQLMLRHDAAGAKERTLAIEAARALFRYDWPLNVRELEQCVRTALVLASGERIDLPHLPRALQDVRSAARATAQEPLLEPRAQRDARLKQLLRDLLEQHKGNVSAVARAMGKHRKQIQRWIERFDLDD